MAVEKYRKNQDDNKPQRSRLPRPAMVVVAALAAFGAVTLVQWVFVSIIGLVKLVLTIVVLLGIAGWVVSAKANR